MVACPLCGHDVDWVTLDQAAQLLNVSKARVSQLIKAGRLPNSIKHKPHSGMQAFWKIPISSLVALREYRLEEGYQVV